MSSHFCQQNRIEQNRKVKMEEEKLLQKLDRQMAASIMSSTIL